MRAVAGTPLGKRGNETDLYGASTPKRSVHLFRFATPATLVTLAPHQEVCPPIPQYPTRPDDAPILLRPPPRGLSNHRRKHPATLSASPQEVCLIVHSTLHRFASALPAHREEVCLIIHRPTPPSPAHRRGLPNCPHLSEGSVSKWSVSSSPRGLPAFPHPSNS